MICKESQFYVWLQLMSQMLTMRNGLSLHPMWLPGVMQPEQLPQTGILLDEENGLINTNRGGTDTYSAIEEGSIHTVFNVASQSTLSNQPVSMSSSAGNITAETSFGLEPLIQAHYEPFGGVSSSKVIYTL